MSKQKPITKNEVRAQVIKYEKRIKHLILKKLRTVKFPVKIKPETLKFSNKTIDDMDIDSRSTSIFAMDFVVKCEDTRFIVDAKIDGVVAIDLTDVKSSDNLLDFAMVGEWNFFADCNESDLHVNWKS